MTSIRSERSATTKSDDARSSSASAYVQFDPITANLDFSAEYQSIDINDGEMVVISSHQTEDKVVSTEQGASLRTCQSNRCKCIDITATTIIIALTWMVIAIPTVLYINTSVRPLFCIYHFKLMHDINNNTNNNNRFQDLLLLLRMERVKL